jgi:hypothetical protein
VVITPPVPNLISNRWQLHHPFQIQFQTGGDYAAHSKSNFKQVASIFSSFCTIQGFFDGCFSLLGEKLQLFVFLS